ncbi:MAG TPA: glycosyl hydrolase family 28-related protein [Frankiaceae bacterium]|jgi:hypothetical protein|nr:glycosyl hydrolase family 28-related protein [Frankiaceae bacterium]
MTIDTEHGTDGTAGEGRLSRRRMLGLGGAAGVGIAAALAHSEPAAALTNSGFLYNVKDAPYLAVGDGVADDTASINNALTAAGGAGGGIVYLPPGQYKISNTLNVPGAVWLHGVGWVPNEAAIPAGSVLFGTNPAAPMVRMNGRGAHISDIAFRQTQNPAVPTAYQPAISVAASDACVERVFLYNVYDGIFMIPGAGLGRLIVRHVHGQPLHYGIRINGATDVVKITDIHFWPYTGTGSWTQANGIGILSERNDNPHLSNIFCFGYSVGVKLTNTGSGPTLRLRMSNADFDACGTGLLMDSGCTAQVSNFTAGSGTAGVNVGGNSVLQLVNCRVSSVTTNGIRVTGGAQCYVDNVIIEGWNGSGAGFPGIENSGAFSVIVGRTRAFGPGGGAPTVSAGVTLDA